MIEVRPARPDELAAAGAVCVAAYVADGHLTEEHWYTGVLADVASRADSAELLVAVEDGRVLGTITRAAAGTPWAEIAEPGEHELRILAVDPAARGRGVGEALVRAALDRARADGAVRVVLTTVEFMTTAQRMYRRLGLRRAPERDWRVDVGAALVYVADLVGRPGGVLEASTWPPLDSHRVGPWQVGVSAGFTRRGNSGLLVGEPGSAVDALDEVEALYRRAGVTPVLRLSTGRSPDPAPDDLAAELDARGYRTVSTTRVLARFVPTGPPVRADLDVEADPTGPGPVPGIEARDEPDDAWLRGWLGEKTRTAGEVTTDVARRLLLGCPARYLTAREGDRVLGVVRAARVEDWVALSCLAVDPGARRRGLGRALTQAALAVPDAQGRPPVRAFLQVEVHNAAALALYERLGFCEVDEYTYRER